jgi:hypothetical protein
MVREESRLLRKSGSSFTTAYLRQRYWTTNGLERFRNGEITLLPGSAIRAGVQVDVAYAYEREAVSRTTAVLKVYRVIPPHPPEEQPKLLS